MCPYNVIQIHSVTTDEHFSVVFLSLVNLRFPADQWDSSGDGRHTGHPEAAEDGPAGPAADAGPVQRDQEEQQAAAPGGKATESCTIVAGRYMECSLHVVFDCVSETSHRFSRCPHTLLACNCMYYLLPSSRLCLHSCLCLSSQAGLLQWTRLFPSLRHRGQNRFPTQPHPQVQTQASTQPPPLDNSPVAEEQVRGHSTLNLKYCLRTAGDVSQKSTCSMGDVVYNKNTFQPTQ